MKFFFRKNKRNKIIESYNKSIFSAKVQTAPYSINDDFLLFFYKNYKWLFSFLKKKTASYRFYQHSLLKKSLNSLSTHGLKLTSISAYFFSYHTLFTSLYLSNSIFKKKFPLYTTFIYNLENYVWLRNVVSLWGWVYSWLDFIFKYKLSRKRVKAGRKKNKIKVKLKYVTPVKRALLINYYIRYLIRDQIYRSYRQRLSAVIFDIFLNYKNSRLHKLKIAIYKKNIEKLKQKS